MNPHSPVRAVGQTRPGSTKVRTLAMLLAAMAASSQLAPTTALAQPAAPAPASTGTIQGRVLNAENGMYLNNARVTVEGTSLETFTNQFGEYTLNNVPTGAATIRVTYTGQEPQVSTVTVAAGAPTVQNISFNTDQSTTSDDGTLILNEFTVAANRFRNAQELAINEQRVSVNIKNVISVDQFGDIPSGNVGELVKFLPGVELDYGAFGGNNQGYSDNDASGISVRGFGPEDTQILIDGMPVSNATPGNLTRQVALDQLSINNASRVELIKVPTPDMPANSIGGQVNLITKSAFEQARPSYSGRVFFNLNSLNASVKKTPGPVKDETYKASPGLELSVTVPVTNSFGFSVTASAVNDANQSYRGQPVWTTSGNAAITNDKGPLSYSNPMLSRFSVTDTSSYVERQSGNIRLDWKPTPAQSLRVNAQYSTYESQEAQRRMDFRPNIAATSSTVTGTDWGSNYTTGSSNNGVADQTVFTRDKEGETQSGQFQYKYSRFGWTVDVAGSSSTSESDYNDRKNGHFSEIALKLNPGPVNFNNFTDGGLVTSVTTFNRANQGGGVRDHTQLANFGFDGTTAKSGEATNKVTKNLLKADIERDLSFLPFIGDNSLSIKVGYRTDTEDVKKSGLGTGYRQILRDGASYTVADILDTYYLDQELGFGLPSQQWGSTYKLFELNEAQNLFYEPTGPEATNTQVNNYNSYVNQQKAIKETKDAYYAQLSGRFFNNRLSFVGGLRVEDSKREGYAPFQDRRWAYVKRADGTLWTDPDLAPAGIQIDRGNGTIDADGNWVPPSSGTGNRPIFMATSQGDALRAALASDGIALPRPLHPSNTHLSSRMLELQPMRYTYGEAKGDPSYSVSTAYKLTEKLDAKVAWSRTFGLPDLEDGANGLISGNNAFLVNDFNLEQIEDNGGFLGSISIANPNLMPEISDNWDFELSYYLASGGRFSASYYRKSVTNASMSIRTDRNSPIFFDLLEGMGFDRETYADYFITTATNSATKQKTDGWEFAVNHDFSFLGRYGRNFAMFGTFTLQSLGQPEVPRPYIVVRPDGSTETVAPTVGTITKRARRKASAGLQYSGSRFSAQIRGVYKDENETQRTLIGPGNYLRTFDPAETRIDVSVNYVINKHFSLFLSGRDVFNAERKEIRKDDLGIYPAYAELADYREFGVVWSTGVNAKF